MTVTPLNRHPSILCPEKNDKRASANADEGTHVADQNANAERAEGTEPKGVSCRG